MFNFVTGIILGDVIGETMHPLTRTVNAFRTEQLPVGGFWPNTAVAQQATPESVAAYTIAVEKAKASLVKAEAEAEKKAKDAEVEAEAKRLIRLKADMERAAKL